MLKKIFSLRIFFLKNEFLLKKTKQYTYTQVYTYVNLEKRLDVKYILDSEITGIFTFFLCFVYFQFTYNKSLECYKIKN